MAEFTYRPLLKDGARRLHLRENALLDDASKYAGRETARIAYADFDLGNYNLNVMRWVVVILIMGGLFYLGMRLMPNSSAIDVTWMEPQVKVGMSKDEVRRTIGVEASVSPGGLGRDETWYYTDTYNDKVHLAIEFIDGHVYKTAVERP